MGWLEVLSPAAGGGMCSMTSPRATVLLIGYVSENLSGWLTYSLAVGVDAYSAEASPCTGLTGNGTLIKSFCFLTLCHHQI